ncbi:MAG TPA: NAD(P)-dependent oxidoreductase [Thermoplasmata archaeon]|nr:NAD(P)-dependent oxidoreductase [Thermoplasmata archaeon]HIH28537.1 NAD(P)-dependent oxidoreductase [Thermoplasmata archaeon]
MNCIVTGASGFIGSALVSRLVHNGHRVRAVLHTTSPKNREHEAEYIVADMTNPASLKSLIKDADIVFHCAALVKDFGSKKDIMDVNLNGTKHLVQACNDKIRRFIFLSHLHSTSSKTIGTYSSSKGLAEQYLLQQYKDHGFPMVIIRPGSVFGPGAKTWCLRPLQAIQQDRIALINHGTGLFLHTYIDNLLDGLLLSLTAAHIEGEIIEITDGDNTTTWKTYLNDLASLAGKPPIKRNLTYTMGSLLSHLMMLRYYLFHHTPLLTPTAVHLFTSQRTVSIEKAHCLLGYAPAVDYAEGMKRIAQWLREENYI